MRPAIESLSLSIDGNSIAGIRQCDPALADPPKMLCVHGWLDNANSFIPLMPYLPSFDLVAVDLPGNGHSDHISKSCTLHEMTYQLSRVLQALNWDRCHVIGHSLGGSIATMLAVALPDALDSLTLIEATGPLSETASEFPQRIKRSINERLKVRRSEPRTFLHKQDAVAVRLDANKMTPASARLIIDRQLRQTEDGYQWRFDPQWRLSSSQYQTEDQVKAILQSIECPVLTVIADQGYLIDRLATEDRLNCLKHRQNITLAGHHHLHMDTPEPVAAAINRFLDARPDLGG